MTQKFYKTAKGVYVFNEGHTHFIERSKLEATHFAQGVKSDNAEGSVLSPMPGKVFRLLVKKDDVVEANQDLVIVEAMKMEHTLKAPFKGKVLDCFVQEGQQVELGQSLLKIGN